MPLTTEQFNSIYDSTATAREIAEEMKRWPPNRLGGLQIPPLSAHECDMLRDLGDNHNKQSLATFQGVEISSKQHDYLRLYVICRKEIALLGIWFNGGLAYRVTWRDDFVKKYQQFIGLVLPGELMIHWIDKKNGKKAFTGRTHCY